MSVAPTVALYAAGCKLLNSPFYFPGSSLSYRIESDNSTAENNAAFQLFISREPSAQDQAYSIHDGGDVRWDELWPVIARCVEA